MEGAVLIMIKVSLHSLSYNSFSPSFNIEISIKKQACWMSEEL